MKGGIIIYNSSIVEEPPRRTDVAAMLALIKSHSELIALNVQALREGVSTAAAC